MAALDERWRADSEQRAASHAALESSTAELDAARAENDCLKGQAERLTTANASLTAEVAALAGTVKDAQVVLTARAHQVERGDQALAELQVGAPWGVVGTGGGAPGREDLARFIS